MTCLDHLIGESWGEKGFPGEEDKFHEGAELNFLAMAGAFEVLT